MARIEFPLFAPCGFVIVRKGGRMDREKDTVLIQTDWDYPGVASRMGWSPCHPCTDGTVNCTECGKTASDMIAEAFEYIEEREGEQFPGLDDYF